MAALYTTSQAIEMGKGTIGIMADYQAQGALFGTKLVKPQSPQLVAIITDALSWGNVAGQDAESLRNITNYLVWLTGWFGQQVQSGQGGGTVIPITPGAGGLEPLEFIVSASSLIPTGSSTLQISDFIGYNVIFVRGELTQYQIDAGGTYFNFNKLTGAFECFGVANEGERFLIMPV